MKPYLESTHLACYHTWFWGNEITFFCNILKYPQFAPQGEVFWDHHCLFAPRKPALIFQNFKLKFLTTFDLIAVGIFWGNKICSLLYLILKKWNSIFWYFFFENDPQFATRGEVFWDHHYFLRFAPRKTALFSKFWT